MSIIPHAESTLSRKGCSEDKKKIFLFHMGPWTTWSSEWHPCPCWGVGVCWSLRSLLTQASCDSVTDEGCRDLCKVFTEMCRLWESSPHSECGWHTALKSSVLFAAASSPVPLSAVQNSDHKKTRCTWLSQEKPIILIMGIFWKYVLLHWALNGSVFHSSSYFLLYPSW